MSIENLKNQLPEVAKDIKLNLSAVLTEEGAPDLTATQIFGTALACAFAIKDKTLCTALMAEFKGKLPDTEIEAAKGAAVIMSMNNVYYRFLHITEDHSYKTMPAKLRMNIIGNPGVEKVNFELYSLAVSSINACGMCIDSHANILTKAGLSKTAIQSAVRIASVIQATSTALFVTTV